MCVFSAFCVFFCFSLDYFVIVLFAFIALYLISYTPVLCRVGRKTLTHSINLLSVIDLQKWNESYTMTMEGWTRLLSIFNNVTAAVLQLETSAEQITNDANTLSSYGLRCVYVL